MERYIRKYMRIVKYLPKQLFGFVSDNQGLQVYFHMRCFKWGDFRHKIPPIIGEEVEVEYALSGTTPGKAPPAKVVRRLHEPKASFGIVEDFNEKRGYGFIRTEDGRSHYLHRTEMTDGRLPMVGMECTFFEGFKQGRTRACYVTLLEETPNESTKP